MLYLTRCPLPSPPLPEGQRRLELGLPWWGGGWPQEVATLTDFTLLTRSRGGRDPAASAGDTAAGCHQTEPRSHGRPGRLPSVAPVRTFNTKQVRPET